MANAIHTQLSAGKAELEEIDRQLSELTRRREIVSARVEAFELSARYIDSLSPSGQIHKANTSKQTRNRMASSVWATVFQSVYFIFGQEFGYDQLNEVCAMQQIDVQKASLRTKMMNYVNDGYFTKVSNGVFRFTKSGQDYFSAGTVTKEPAEAGSLNVVSTADSSVMPDPKSSASEPFQRSTSTLPGSTFAPADPINPQLPPIMRR